MENLEYCEICGAEMAAFARGSYQGTECRQCGWGRVTEQPEAIRLDGADYTLHIPSCDSAFCEALRGFGATPEAAQNGIRITDKALAIRSIAKALQRKGIGYTVTPEFPYEI